VGKHRHQPKIINLHWISGEFEPEYFQSW
jgi:hypothetical protein